ncbi:pimeloyl-CoA dehydrogenase small subunit [Proteobacteria bacterium 005FR1]|nr:pimeloyl-CoA dehydrogenase small subunit [Proteobacteria bacterium 005FR1]
MDFSYSEEQQMLRDSIAKFVNQDYDFDTRQKIVASEGGFSKENWKLFAELGWLMVPFKEEDGGLGGTAVDLVGLMEELGKGIVVEPIIPTVILGGGIIAEAGSAQQKEELLGTLMEGNLQLAFAFAEPQSRYNTADIATKAEKSGDSYKINGHKAVVLNANNADKIIVAVRTSGDQRDENGISLLIVDADAAGIEKRSYETVDGHQGADLYFKDVTVPAANLLGEEGKALSAIQNVVDRAALAVAAEAVGAMEVTYKKTVEYTKTRKQFGVPIAVFQALQHRMAEMFIEHEQAKSIMLMAAMQSDAAGGVDRKAISAAKARIGKAARLVGQEAVQLHGGIGVTDELDVGHYFKRLTTIQFIFGSTDWHTERFAGL